VSFTVALTVVLYTNVINGRCLTQSEPGLSTKTDSIFMIFAFKRSDSPLLSGQYTLDNIWWNPIILARSATIELTNFLLGPWTPSWGLGFGETHFSTLTQTSDSG
jgi:hypothetical protein